MNKIYQSTKTGRQIDRAVDITEKLPSQIEAILNEIKILQENPTYKDLIPQRLSELLNDITDQSYNSKSKNPQSGKAVAEALAKLLGSAPENLDTLEELAKALNNDEEFANKILELISQKMDIKRSYYKETIDAMVKAKADINNVYYKETIDAMVKAKADINNVYYRGTIDAMLNDKVDKFKGKSIYQIPSNKIHSITNDKLYITQNVEEGHINKKSIHFGDFLYWSNYINNTYSVYQTKIEKMYDINGNAFTDFDSGYKYTDIDSIDISNSKPIYVVNYGTNEVIV